MASKGLASGLVRALVAVGLGAGAFLGLAGRAGASGPGEHEVVIVGDSITAMNVPQIDEILATADAPAVHFEALGARQIATSFEWYGWRSSGLDAIEAVHGAGIDPTLWIVELGTNDLPLTDDCRCRDRYVVAGALIDLVTDAIGPGERIAWVTVLNRDDRDSSRVFNAALRSRAAANPRLDVLDWAGPAAEHPEWFMDQVHPNELGAAALAGIYADGIDQIVGQLDPTAAPATAGTARLRG